MRAGRAVLVGGACAAAVALAYSVYAGSDLQESVAPATIPDEPGLQERAGAEPAAGHGIRWAEVTRIVDGDTVHLDGESHRLVLVNTPERGEPGFDEAGAFVGDRCMGKTVAYDLNDPQPADRYDRHLSLVYCDGPAQPSINELLIEAGHSGQYTRFCHESEFADQAWTGC